MAPFCGWRCHGRLRYQPQI